MKNKKSLGILAAVFATALSFTALAPSAYAYDTPNHKGFTATRIDVTGKNEALAGWQHYFNNEVGSNGKVRGMVYESENMYMGVTADGHTGNALKLQRNTNVGEIVAYSYSFDVESDTSYIISAWVKNTCADVSSNCYRFRVKELGANGYIVSGTDEFADQLVVTGAKEDWTEVKFSYRTNVSGKKLILKIAADGEGDFLVDDITVRSANAGVNKASYKMLDIGNNGTSEDPETMTGISSSDLSSDSSDNDGVSLKLDDHDVLKTVFGMLPRNNNYTLSFKYKKTTDAADSRFSIRLDNYAIDGDNLTRAWYAAGVSGGSQTEWNEYSYTFSSGNDLDISWIGIAAYGGYLIDELKILGTDEDGETMQYIVNGSFSGAYVDGYSLGGNYNVAVQEDGTAVFASSSVTRGAESGQRGYLKFDNISKLVAGKKYTLSFDYRSGGDGAGNVYYGIGWGDATAPLTDICTLGKSVDAKWVHKDVEFTAIEGARFEVYGDAGIGWPTYFRNFAIVDEDGNDIVENKTLVAPELVLGDNAFPYGTFEGNGEYVTDDWTFTGNAGIYGLVFDEPGSPNDWKIRMNGTAEAPATAVSKDITLTEGTTTLMVDRKEYTGSVTASIIAGETEIFAEDNGLFELPENTASIKIKFTSSEGYVAFKYVDLQQHTHAQPQEGQVKEKTATCTDFGGKYYTCETCENIVYIEKQEKLAHDFEHIHVDASCKDGIDKDVCKNCHQEFNVTVLEANGEHAWKHVVVKEATCTATGLEKDVCENCSAERNNKVTPKTDHDYEEGVCTVCGAEDPDYVPVTPDDPQDKPVSGGCKGSFGGGAALSLLAAAAIAAIIKRKTDR